MHFCIRDRSLHRFPLTLALSPVGGEGIAYAYLAPMVAL